MEPSNLEDLKSSFEPLYVVCAEVYRTMVLEGVHALLLSYLLRASRLIENYLVPKVQHDVV